MSDHRIQAYKRAWAMEWCRLLSGWFFKTAIKLLELPHCSCYYLQL
jgi:hypothetical protein